MGFLKRWLGIQETTAAGDLSGPYPNGSVPYGDDPRSGGAPESLARRAKRFACASVNHHPRRYDGSWCGGYGYVCSRCHMYADPMSKATRDATYKALGDDPDQMDVAAAFRGGPSRRIPPR